MTSIRLIIKAAVFIITILIVSGCRQSVQQDKLSIPYEKYTMPNGLEVILHTDHSDPIISYAIMYHVGSSREVPGKTGFAHLFEHLLFTGSENVPAGRFDMVIEGTGGSNNGGTSRDYTVYFEQFPRNALEKIFWLESDRMGFFINSVTQRLMAIQQNVVQNEKRQYEDNSPYGFTEWVINKNLYPEGHPYSWTVIGEMEDLKNATLGDVKEYYDTFYGPNNATLVLSGDFNPDSIKPLIDKYFGEIKSHGKVSPREPMPVSLKETVKLYHEDNFANVPEITMVWPASELYSQDAYALDFLARLLSEGKKTPLYNVLVKEKQLTSATSAYNNAEELTGEFTISIRANEGKTLKEIEEAVLEAFSRFEKEGITEKDIERIKASAEMNFYREINSVLGKSFRLATYNTFLNDPGFIEKDIENIKSVTLADVLRVYNKYLKGRPHVVTSFVPKGRREMMAENSIPAVVKEENISEASQVEIAGTGDIEIMKTPSLIDRTVEPPAGKEPEVKIPQIWKAGLKNGIQVYGIQNSELPLVSMSIMISGGVLQDKIELPGVAGMMAAMLPQGTKNKTPEELEEEIELLGSDISVNAGREEITMNINMLSRNFGKTVMLMKEILLEPRWDTAEFSIAKNRALNLILQEEAQPRSVASQVFYKLVYGSDHIFGYNPRGTKESVAKITIESLKEYYKRNFSPSVTQIVLAGNVSREQVLEALAPLEAQWESSEVNLNIYPEPSVPGKSAIYFVDIPGSRQSVIYIGYPALSRNDPDYVRTDVVNYRLGGAFTSIFNQILREEKGFTYGARSYFQEMKVRAPFIATSMVRSDATFESVKIFREEMEKYRNGISADDLQFVKNYMLRSNALRFETNNALTNMLATIAKYDLPDDYVKQEDNIIKNMTLEEHRTIAQKYIVPDRMYWVVVGDAATQMKPLEKIGFGKPLLFNLE